MRPGAILRLHVAVIHNPKIKWFAVLRSNRTSDAILVALINTNINYSVNRDDEIQTYHLPLMKGEYPDLTHDCYLDCARPYELSLAQTAHDAATGDNVMKGALKPEHLALAVEMIKSSPLVEKKVLRKFGLA